MRRLRLVHQRKTLGLSQERLAAALGVDRSTVVRWERAETEPQPWVRPRLARVLGVSAEDLTEMLAESHHSAAPPRIAAVSKAGGLNVDLEDFRRGLDRSVTKTSLTADQVDELLFGVQASARQCLQAPPLEMLQDLIVELARVEQYLKDTQPPVLQQRLYKVASLLAVLIADELMVLGDHRQSRAWHGTARLTADQTYDLDLRATVRVLGALLPLYYGHPLEAVRLTEDAELLAEERPTLASALAPMYRAVGLAQLNATDASKHALRLAHNRVGELDCSDRTTSVFGLTEQRWQFYQARVLCALGRIEEAWPIQEAALAGYPDDVVGDPALIHFDRSVSLVRTRQIAAGFALAEQTLHDLPEPHRTGIFLRAARQVLAAVPVDERAAATAIRYRKTLRGFSAV